MGVLAHQFYTLVNLDPVSQGFQPASFDELFTVLRRKGYLSDGLNYQADAWGRPFVLVVDHDEDSIHRYVIMSAGRDGIMGTRDDIRAPTAVVYERPTSGPSSAPEDKKTGQVRFLTRETSDGMVGGCLAVLVKLPGVWCFTSWINRINRDSHLFTTTGT